MTDSKYVEVAISLKGMQENQSDIFIAELAGMGYDGFQEESDSLKAYIAADSFDEKALEEISKMYQFHFTFSTIEKQNWNILWESNFSPMQVDDFVGVRAGFHPPFEGVAHELIITPKMSFGTGHHGTTYSVMKLMQAIDFNNKSVFDFGTGTGILAILAEKLGATNVLGIDNDSWCIENTEENIKVNDCKKIRVELADQLKTDFVYDIVIANINRHILEQNAEALAKITRKGGVLIISGLLLSDEKDMVKLFNEKGFQYQKTQQKDGWVAIQFLAR